MTEDISEDESRVCRCTMVLFPDNKSFPRNEDVLEEVSSDYIVTCPAFNKRGQLGLSYTILRGLCIDKHREEVYKENY